MKQLIRRVILAALLGGAPSLVTTSCSDPKGNHEERSGTLEIALRASAASGTEYRLRDGTFDIAGPSHETVSTEDDPDAQSIDVDLDVGDYTITLGSGWFLERRGDDGLSQPVEATLLSASTQSFSIVAEQTTNVRYRFRVAGEVVEVGGSLSIGIEVVEETPLACDERGSSSCATAWHEVAALPSSATTKIDHVDAVHRLNSDPSTLLIVTGNVAGSCPQPSPWASGSIFRATLDPQTGSATSVAEGPALAGIQDAAGQILETSSGVLFTGSGACGSSVLYYSRDQGLTWNSIYVDYGSVLSLAEFQGRIYVGTSAGAVYKLSENLLGYSEVFSIPVEDNRISALRVYEDRLYVGVSFDGTDPSIGWEVCDGVQPIYVSSDGIKFEPMNQIDNCMNLAALEVVGDRLIAVMSEASFMAYPGTARLYGPISGARTASATFRLDSADHRFLAAMSHGLLAAAGDRLVFYGEYNAGEGAKLYISDDTVSWTLLGDGPEPNLSGISFEDGTLYAFGRPDTSGGAHVYGLSLDACEPFACRFPLTAVPSALNLGSVPIGSCTGASSGCVTATVTLTYTGTGSVEINGLGAADETGGMNFRVVNPGSSCWDTSLEQGDSCDVVIQASPTALGAGTGRLEIWRDGGGQESLGTVRLEGLGTAP